MNRIGYLSGSLRISTRQQAAEHGPSCHVLGTLSGFRSAGWEVFPYIVGDRMPLHWVAGSKLRLQSQASMRLAADLLRSAANVWHSRKAYREIGKKVDWVYERYGVFQSMGLPFQRQGIPWILETNTPFALENKWESSRRSVCLTGAAQRQEKQAYQRCDALVVQTAALKDIVVDFAGIEAEKVFVVPNAVDIARFSDLSPLRKFPAPTIGFVGALRRWQALENLIRAIRDLSSEGISYNLVIVGEGEKQQEWRRLAEHIGVAERVCFAGSVPAEEIPAWIAGFDIGFCGQAVSVAGQAMYFSPLKLYEYMAAAKPVLASDHEDARRLVVPGETGYLFAPDSFIELVCALRQAWRQRDSWPAMGSRARQRIAAGHTWEIRISAAIARWRNFLQHRGFSTLR